MKESSQPKKKKFERDLENKLEIEINVKKKKKNSYTIGIHNKISSLNTSSSSFATVRTLLWEITTKQEREVKSKKLLLLLLLRWWCENKTKLKISKKILSLI